MAPTIATSLPISWDVKTFVLTQGHGVKGLSDMGLKALPPQYIQPQSERLEPSSVAVEESVPVIDMSKWHDPNVANSICEAAEKWGFFQIINHGVEIQVLENVKAATHRFFELPAEEKKKYSKENSRSNSVRFGTSFTPDAENALEWKDYLSLFYVSDDEAASLWPPVCKYQALEYKKSTEVVIRKLLEALMKRLNVTHIDKTKELLLMGSKRINLNYYPTCPNPELTVGVGRHSDVSTLTILLQDEIGGLYVRKDGTENWIHVPPVSGSLVINIGDALQIMSNGRYKSVEHRMEKMPKEKMEKMLKEEGELTDGFSRGGVGDLEEHELSSLKNVLKLGSRLEHKFYSVYEHIEPSSITWRVSKLVQAWCVHLTLDEPLKEGSQVERKLLGLFTSPN
ncbi:hypothetical protein LguiB_001798 [Lonicera macranthoides]